MTPTKKKKRRPDWSGRYTVERDGRKIAIITMVREWSSAGPKHTISVNDGPSETFTDPGYAMQRALKLIAPGEMVWPWYDGCEQTGFRLRAEGIAPWEPAPDDEPSTEASSHAR